MSQEQRVLIISKVPLIGDVGVYAASLGWVDGYAGPMTPQEMITALPYIPIEIDFLWVVSDSGNLSTPMTYETFSSPGYGARRMWVARPVLATPSTPLKIPMDVLRKGIVPFLELPDVIGLTKVSKDFKGVLTWADLHRHVRNEADGKVIPKLSMDEFKQLATTPSGAYGKWQELSQILTELNEYPQKDYWSQNSSRKTIAKQIQQSLQGRVNDPYLQKLLDSEGVIDFWEMRKNLGPLQDYWTRKLSNAEDLANYIRYHEVEAKKGRSMEEEAERKRLEKQYSKSFYLSKGEYPIIKYIASSALQQDRMDLLTLFWIKLKDVDRAQTIADYVEAGGGRTGSLDYVVGRTTDRMMALARIKKPPLVSDRALDWLRRQYPGRFLQG